MGLETLRKRTLFCIMFHSTEHGCADSVRAVRDFKNSSALSALFFVVNITYMLKG